ncbi:PREDICTED: cysteine-rich repeat secretory protein 55-like [Nelumbo nucifera]|nr:PREDICTED: cysteine-rich repeat secretory protein 55-like [Nelumbo nucifera]
MQIRQRCPNQGEAWTWFDYCFLRFGIQSFTGKADVSFGIIYWNVQNITNPANFYLKLGALMDRVRKQALESSSVGLFGNKGVISLTSSETLYALVQCTRDLSKLQCGKCLDIAISQFSVFCLNRKGCRVLYGSCFAQYELYPFFFPLSNSTYSASSAKYLRAAIYP